MTPPRIVHFVESALRQKSPWGNGIIDFNLGIGTFPLQVQKPRLGETSRISRAGWAGVYPSGPEHDLMVRAPDFQTNLWSRLTYQRDAGLAYDGWPDSQLERFAQDCARAAGLDIEVRVGTAEIGPLAPQLQRRRLLPFRVLQIVHDKDGNHAEVLGALLRQWLPRCPHVPPIEMVSVRGQAQTQRRLTEADALGIASALLGQPRDEPLSLDEAQIAALRGWANRQGLAADQGPLQQLAQLIRTPLGPLSEAARQDTLATHVAVGTMSTFAPAYLAELRQAYASGHDLENVILNLSVHLVQDAYALLQGLQLFGKPAEVNLLASSYSGEPAMRRLAEAWGMRVLGPDAAAEYFHPHALTLRQASGQRSYDYLVSATRRTVWLKSAALRRAVGREHERMLWHPEQRFIVQNRSDLDQMRGASANVVELCASEMKALEAWLVGDVAALMAAREVRERWQKRIGEVDIIVIGAGLIGGDILAALLRRGMDPQRLHVVDPDDEVRGKFAALGCKVYADVDRFDAYPGYSYSFVAAPDVELKMEALRRLGQHTLVHGMTTEGKALSFMVRRAHQVIRERHPAPRPMKEWICGIDSDAPERFVDLCLDEWVPRGSTCTALANGYPPGLIDPRSPRRFELNAMALLRTILAAAAKPADGPAPDDARLDALGVELAKRHGLLAVTPLRANTAAERALLDADLESFRPT